MLNLSKQMHLHFLDGRIQIINLPSIFTEHAPVSG